MKPWEVIGGAIGAILLGVLFVAFAAMALAVAVFVAYFSAQAIALPFAWFGVDVMVPAWIGVTIALLAGSAASVLSGASGVRG